MVAAEQEAEPGEVVTQGVEVVADEVIERGAVTVVVDAQPIVDQLQQLDELVGISGVELPRSGPGRSR